MNPLEKTDAFPITPPEVTKKSKVLGKPFVKWVGGKGSLSNLIIKNLPKRYKAYYEPFVGGGAVFFKLKPENAFLSDINQDLISTYDVVKNDVENLIHRLKILKERHTNEGKKFYLEMRNLSAAQDPLTTASRFIYLNKTCFNGLYRVNSKGTFNVPMGDYQNPLIADEETLRNDSLILQNAKIEMKPFDEIKPHKEDFIYFDPPYDDTYNGYDKDIFGTEQQKELAKFCNRLHERGCYFMLSNSDTENVRSLYKNFTLIEVDNIRSVNCKGSGRGKTKELLIKNYK